MISMRKIFKNKETKAALLAGMTLLTLPGCGKKNVETDPEPGASISIEEDTTKKKNNIETTVENMIEGKTTGENNGTEENTYVDNGTEYVEYTDSTEGYTEGQTEGKTEGQTEGQTEGKTEAKIEGKTGSTGVQLPSDHRVGNSYEDPTEAKTTHKTTTIKNKDIKVTTTTKKVTTAKPTTTKKVTTTTKVVTTQKPTEPPTTQPPAPTYDYTLENITQSAEVFNYFAEQMNNDIYDGSNVKATRFNGEEYWSNGSKESRVALLLLNENANYKNGVLNEVLRGYSDYDIAQGVYYFYKAPSTQDTCETNIDFNDYALDKEIGDYMNKLNAARKHGDDTGDYSEMDAILGEFFYGSQYEKAYHNMASFYYTIGAGGYTPECSYHGDCCSLADDGNFYGIQEIVEGKVKELSR